MGKTFAVLTIVAALLLPAQPAAALEVDPDLLALVAMPLAVAAVSEITDVPTNELIDMVSLLNDADVPPVQFVEVVRYVPVALVVEDTTQPRFIEVVREREQSGLRGIELVTFIEDRLRPYGLPTTVNLNVTAPRVVEVVDTVDDPIVPVFVRTRVAQLKAHPHGGPPGQRKKQLGVQTGAEVVHRTTRTVVVDDDRSDDARGRGRDQQPRVVKPQKHVEQHVEKHESHGRGNAGHAGNSHGNGKNKGKGKGKG
jgi:hypothetical protein